MVGAEAPGVSVKRRRLQKADFLDCPFKSCWKHCACILAPNCLSKSTRVDPATAGKANKLLWPTTLPAKTPTIIFAVEYIVTVHRSDIHCAAELPLAGAFFSLACQRRKISCQLLTDTSQYIESVGVSDSGVLRTCKATIVVPFLTSHVELGQKADRCRCPASHCCQAGNGERHSAGYGHAAKGN